MTAAELEGLVGGGAAPDRVLPSWGILVEPGAGLSAGAVAAAMLESTPAVVALTRDDRVVIDLRTVTPSGEPAVVSAVLGAFREEQS